MPQRESDHASKERLQIARKAIADVEDRLQPLKVQYENEKRRGDEVAQVRRRIDELKAKADDAERRSVVFVFRHTYVACGQIPQI